MSVQKPREIAVRVLQRHAIGAEYVEDLFEQELLRTSLSPIDRALCQELVFGIVRWKETLNWLIARKTEGRIQKVSMQIFLQLGLYQMFWLDRIPNHAAVHETVELAKRMGFGPQAGFINAVLRGYTRERVETETLLKRLKVEQPDIGYSHPAWLCEQWESIWGSDKTRQLLEWNNTPPPVFARLNKLKADSPRLFAQWKNEGVTFTPRSWDWTGEGLIFELNSHPSLARLRSFNQGLFYIQDPSTLLAVHELDPRPAETILDLCSAPGGKTTYIAQLTANRCRIFAQDNQPDRLKLVQENCARLGVTCVETSLAPDTILTNPAKRFDRVLIDAPCSNTGVMRRRIDLRWRIRPEEIERLRTEQLKILNQAAPRLKPGGILIYSTCSLQPEENGGVVRDFLQQHSEYKLEKERELLPFVEGTDGAYVAKLKRAAAG